MVLREDEAARKDKLVVSLVGVERKEYATALFPSFLENLDGEGHKYMIVRTFTGINVCSHWIRDDFTVTPIRNRKPAAESEA